MKAEEIAAQEAEQEAKRQEEVKKQEDDKSKDINANLQTALKKEREEKAELKSKLDAYEAEKAQQEEKKKIKEGKQEEVINELKNKIAELEPKVKAYDDLIVEIENERTNKLNEITSKLPEAIKDKYTSLVDWFDTAKKISFFENILQDIKVEDIKHKPEWWEQKKPTWIEAIQAKKDAGQKLTPTESATLLSHIRSKGR